jgi:hypothetical protein
MSVWRRLTAVLKDIPPFRAKNNSKFSKDPFWGGEQPLSTMQPFASEGPKTTKKQPITYPGGSADEDM